MAEKSARRGSIGAFIEDKNSGTILLQQALRRQMLVHPIDSKLTAMGKDERAISVSGYVHRELVKYTDRAFEKTVIYKRHSRNHLLDQVESFRVGDRDSDREDEVSVADFGLRRLFGRFVRLLRRNAAGSLWP